MLRPPSNLNLFYGQQVQSCFAVYKPTDHWNQKVHVLLLGPSQCSTTRNHETWYWNERKKRENPWSPKDENETEAKRDGDLEGGKRKRRASSFWCELLQMRPRPSGSCPPSPCSLVSLPFSSSLGSTQAPINGQYKETWVNALWSPIRLSISLGQSLIGVRSGP